MQRSSFGVDVRAIATDADLAAAAGVRVERVRVVIWGVSGLLAGVAAIIIASRLTVDAFYTMPFLIKALVGGIIGGFDRLVAPLATAFGLGLYEAWAVYILGAQYQTPVVFVLIVVLLAVLPRRFLIESAEARA
jgi:branched-chain amino acid transport system permease protein